MGDLPKAGDPVTLIWKAADSVVIRLGVTYHSLAPIADHFFVLVQDGRAASVADSLVTRAIDTENRTWCRGHGEREQAALLTTFLLMDRRIG